MADKRRMVIERLETMKKVSKEVIALTCDQGIECEDCFLFGSDCSAVMDAANFDISDV